MARSSGSAQKAAADSDSRVGKQRGTTRIAFNLLFLLSDRAGHCLCQLSVCVDTPVFVSVCECVCECVREGAGVCVRVLCMRACGCGCGWKGGSWQTRGANACDVCVC